MDDLRESMVQMRHDAVEEIKEGLRDCIDEVSTEIFEKYIIYDIQTGQEVELEGTDLMEMISDSEWYQHKIIELLKRNEDDALEQMTWIAESGDAPQGCAPDERFISDPFDRPISASCLPVGREQYITGIESLGHPLLAQEDFLRKAHAYLQTIPKVTDELTAAQEAQAIAKVKHMLGVRWLHEARRAQHIYKLLMNGRGQGEKIERRM